MYEVHVEFERVQTYLFDIPRLQAMVGANALLGRLIRVELPDLAIVHGATEPSGLDEVDPPQAIEDDPLSIAVGWRQQQKPDHGITTKIDGDNPAQQLRRGILSRDGGHFVALFPGWASAQAFADAVPERVRSVTPGLRARVSAPRELGAGDDEPTKGPTPSTSISLVDLPIFALCQDRGTGPASHAIREPWSEDRERLISSRAFALRLAGRGLLKNADRKSAFQQIPRDVVGLLTEELALGDRKPPADLNDLASGGYLAVIHADGNGVGKRFKAWQNAADDDLSPLAKRVRNEAFFYRMRVNVRIAVQKALRKVFTERSCPSDAPRPYQLLMLGGDDLVMVCQARFALPFVRALTRALAALSGPEGYRSPPLEVSAGVVIAAPNIPFHHLHARAEALASSAKGLSRAHGGISTVDWMVFTESWSPDPAAHRQQFDFLQYRVGDTTESLALTRKPYRTLGTGYSLDALLEAAEGLNSEASDAGIARTQRHGLSAALRAGRRAGLLAFAELPPTARTALCTALGLGATPASAGDGPWQEHDAVANGPRRWSTQLLDLFEMIEISTLGRRAEANVEADQ